MDSSHVSLCSVKLSSDGFDQFRCDKAINLGVSLENLSKLLKCAGNDDTILLTAQEDTDILSLTFESTNGERVSDFELKLMDIESDHLGIPEQEYKCNIRMPAAEFQRIIRDLTVIGDSCTISVTKEGIKFSTKGDLGVGNILLKAHQNVEKDDESVVIDMQEPVELNFAIRYLGNFTKATPLGPTVTLSLSPDVPILVDYTIANMGYVRYYLAPKIDEDA